MTITPFWTLSRQSWTVIADRYVESRLVLGNGFSISLDKRFRSDFLTDTAIESNAVEGDRVVVANVLHAVGARVLRALSPLSRPAVLLWRPSTRSRRFWGFLILRRLQCDARCFEPFARSIRLTAML